MFQGPSLSLLGVQRAASHFETALTANCIFFIPELPSSWRKYEFYDEALIMYVIANSFWVFFGFFCKPGQIVGADFCAAAV